jgi:hypothetical protein
MSEFQYCEFQAIDRPLDQAARGALRRISSRARITAHSLVNTYEWGNFKGDPRRLMADWFDLFLYWANWGSRIVMLRLPRRALDPSGVQPYAVKDVLEAWSAGEFTNVAVFGERDDVDDWYEEGYDETDDDDIGRSPPSWPCAPTLPPATGDAFISAGSSASKAVSRMRQARRRARRGSRRRAAL